MCFRVDPALLREFRKQHKDTKGFIDVWKLLSVVGVYTKNGHKWTLCSPYFNYRWRPGKHRQKVTFIRKKFVSEYDVKTEKCKYRTYRQAEQGFYVYLDARAKQWRFSTSDGPEVRFRAKPEDVKAIGYVNGMRVALCQAVTFPKKEYDRALNKR